MGTAARAAAVEASGHRVGAGSVGGERRITGWVHPETRHPTQAACQGAHSAEGGRVAARAVESDGCDGTGYAASGDGSADAGRAGRDEWFRLRRGVDGWRTGGDSRPSCHGRGVGGEPGRQAGASMILLPHVVRIYVAREPVNLHKSFEGLSNEVRSALSLDPLTGHLFLFLNRTRSQLKILMWTRGGYTILHKRLDRGRFTFPDRLGGGAGVVQIDVHELSMLLEGLEVKQARASVRWNPPLRV